MSGDAIQLVNVYRADKPSKHCKVATVSYPVEASAATLRDVHNQASTFAVNAKGSAAAVQRGRLEGCRDAAHSDAQHG